MLGQLAEQWQCLPSDFLHLDATEMRVNFESARVLAEWREQERMKREGLA